MSAKVWIGAGILLIFCGMQFVFAQETTGEKWMEWQKSISEKLTAFMPAPVPGLIGRMPWDGQDYSKISTYSGWGEGGGEPQEFYPVGVEQDCRVADLALARQYEALSQQEQALLKQAEEQARQMKKEDLIKRANELEKIAKEKTDITFRVKWLRFSIEANRTPQERDGEGAQPAGTMKGNPLYRCVWNTGVRLSVFVGPQGFKNPPSSEKKVSGDVKCILVIAQLHSESGTLKQEETLAQQMLEKVDYVGLARLLKQ